MMDLATEISKACSILGLRVELGFELSLGNDIKIHTVARIPDLGALNGMLIISSFDQVRKHLKELDSADYGFSVLDEPSPNAKFDIVSIQEMFIDWGWSGDPKHRPKWMDASIESKESE